MIGAVAATTAQSCLAGGDRAAPFATDHQRSLSFVLRYMEVTAYFESRKTWSGWIGSILPSKNFSRGFMTDHAIR